MPKYLLTFLAVIAIIAFYAGGSFAILEPASFTNLIVEEEVLSPFGSAYAAFLTWLATSYAAMAVSLIIVLFSFRVLFKLSKGMRNFGLICFCLISGASIVLLVFSGNVTIDVARPSLCNSVGFCNPELGFSPLKMSEVTKTALNAIFQVAAVGSLCGFMFSVSDADERYPERQKMGVALFYCASVLLTLIVMTDLLFYEFMSGLLPAESVLLAFQKGTTVFFAIITTTTLVAALMAGFYLGLGPDKITQTGVDNQRVLDSVSSLIGSASVSRSFAALAPVIVTVLSGFVQGG